MTTTTTTTPSTTTSTTGSSKSLKPDDDDNSDAARFSRYLAYLYSYWKTPQYSQYLTHPAATLRNLELLQQERFRRDVARPEFADLLAEGFTGFDKYEVEPVVEGGAVEAQQANEENDQAEGNDVNGITGPE